MRRILSATGFVIAVIVAWFIARGDAGDAELPIDSPAAASDASRTSEATLPTPAETERLEPAADTATGDASGPGRTEAGPAPSSANTDTTATAILLRTAERYEGIRSLRADFTLRADNPLLRRTTTSRGTLLQKRPDRLLLDFSEPEGDVIASDGEHIWVYYPSADARQVIRTSAGAGAGGVDLQAQFVGDPARRFEHSHEGTEDVAGRPADVLSLRPREDAGYRELRIWVDRADGLVRRFRITELNDAVRLFELSALEINVALDNRLFDFTPPADARVVVR
jgi:chaperone LolA